MRHPIFAVSASLPTPKLSAEYPWCGLARQFPSLRSGRSAASLTTEHGSSNRKEKYREYLHGARQGLRHDLQPQRSTLRHTNPVFSDTRESGPEQNRRRQFLRRRVDLCRCWSTAREVRKGREGRKNAPTRSADHPDACRARIPRAARLRVRGARAVPIAISLPRARESCRRTRSRDRALAPNFYYPE